MQASRLITTVARTLLLIIAACFGIVQCTQAATLVSGAVTTNTSWMLAQSPYQVTADVVIQNGALLTIEPGVTVGFDSGTNLTIGVGSLNARGTAGQPITFTSSLEVAGNTPAAGDWGQIRFLDLTNDNTSIIEHAGIRYGHGISIQSASPTFNYLQIDSNLGAAISVDLNSSPKGIGNKASGNTLNGISVPPGDVLGTVTWGIKGIPYVVEAGVVSVGASPAISTLNLSEIQQGETLDALINGTRLSGAQSVGISTAGTTGIVKAGVTDTLVTIQISASPSATLGSADIDLQVAAGRVKLRDALQVIQPQPTVSELSPNSVYTSDSGSSVTVTGKNFVSTSVVQLDGADLSTSYKSTSSLDAVLPVLTAGNKSMAVKQSDPLIAGGFLVSKPAVLNVVDPLLVMTPKSVSQPKSIPLNLIVSIPLSAGVGGLVVNLSSSAPSIASVPSSVTIAEGAMSTSFSVATVGTGSATITATVMGFADATTMLTLGSGEALIPVLTSPTSASAVGVASASSSYNAPPFGVASAFDNNPATRWSNTSTGLGHWLKWSFVTARAVTAFEYATYNELFTQLQYSDNDVTWFSASAVFQEGKGSFLHPTTTGTTPHRFWRLYVSQVYGATVANWYGYETFQLYGYPPMTLTPASISQEQGQPLNLVVSLPFPAPVGGVVVNLASSAPSIVGVPATVMVPEGATDASIVADAIASGRATVTASSTGFSDALSSLVINGRPTAAYALIPTLSSATSSSNIGIASASNSYESPPFGVYSAFDNNPTGRWSTSTTALGHWLKWSFVTAHNVTEFEYSTANNLFTQLQYSDDNANWLPASAIYQDGQANFVHPATTGTAPHRFWRLYVSQVYGATVANWYGYEKFQLYSDVPLSTTASGWYSTQVPSSGTDGSLATGWNGGSFAPAWIAMDLGVVRPIHQVNVYAGTGSPAGITNYTIQVSDDGIVWTSVAQASSGAYWTNTPVTATGRYVRLNITSHTGGSWIALHEFNVQ